MNNDRILPEGIQAWAINRLIERLAEEGFAEFSARDLFITESRIRDHLRSLEEKSQIESTGGRPKTYKLVAKNGRIRVQARLTP